MMQQYQILGYEAMNQIYYSNKHVTLNAKQQVLVIFPSNFALDGKTVA